LSNLAVISIPSPFSSVLRRPFENRPKLDVCERNFGYGRPIGNEFGSGAQPMRSFRTPNLRTARRVHRLLRDWGRTAGAMPCAVRAVRDG
jgi:hypothetical protein